MRRSKFGQGVEMVMRPTTSLQGPYLTLSFGRESNRLMPVAGRRCFSDRAR